MKSQFDERMPWPEEYFGFDMRHASAMSTIPAAMEELVHFPRRGRFRRPTTPREPRPATVSPVELSSVQDLSMRDVRRIRWARGAGLLGPIYGGTGLYLVTDPALGVNPRHQFQQGRYMTIQDLREHIRRLEEFVEKESNGKTTEKHGRCTAG